MTNIITSFDFSRSLNWIVLLMKMNNEYSLIPIIMDYRISVLQHKNVWKETFDGIIKSSYSCNGLYRVLEFVFNNKMIIESLNRFV